MTIALRRRLFPSLAETPLRRFFFVWQFLAVGLLSIAASGAICLGLSHALGENAIAGDSRSAHLSAARCADLFEYYPQAKSCSAAELAHHTDEVVSYRLYMGVLAAVVFGASLVAARFLRLSDDERRQQRPWHYLLGAASFGLAAGVLLSFAVANVIEGSSAGTARWFSDGGVALALFILYAGVVALRSVQARR